MERMPATSGCLLIIRRNFRNFAEMSVIMALHGGASSIPFNTRKHTISACSQQGAGAPRPQATTSTYSSCGDQSMPAVPRVSRFWTHLKAVFSQDLCLHFLFLQYMRSSPSAWIRILAAPLSSFVISVPPSLSSEKWEQNNSEELVRKIELTYRMHLEQCLAPRKYLMNTSC